MHHLVDILAAFQTYAKANPVMAGLVGLWTAAAISFVFVRTPVRIWNFFVRQFTTSLSIDNSTYGYSLENFNAFLVWFQKHRFSRFSRNFSFDPTWDKEEENLDGSRVILGPGEGKHFFVFGGRFFWVVREKVKTNGTHQSNMQSYEVRIKMVGRSQKKLLELVDAFRYRHPQNKVGIYRSNRGEWSRIADAQKRPISTVFLDEEIKKSIFDDIDWFLNNKMWYTDRGIPYKLTFMLWGPPGSGKSSIIKAVASTLGMNIGLINLAEMSDTTLEASFANVPKKSIVAIEDFDTTAATKSRGALSMVDKKLKEDEQGDSPLLPAPALSGNTIQPPSADGDLASMLHGLTLSGFLNALDGLIPLDGQIIFLTSNKVDDLDEAVVRDGRMDRKIFVGELSDSLIRGFFKMLYPEFPEETLNAYHPGNISPVMGARLYGLFGKHKNDPQGFLDALPKVL
jgi:hypothetical protein